MNNLAGNNAARLVLGGAVEGKLNSVLTKRREAVEQAKDHEKNVLASAKKKLKVTQRFAEKELKNPGNIETANNLDGNYLQNLGWAQAKATLLGAIDALQADTSEYENRAQSLYMSDFENNNEEKLPDYIQKRVYAAFKNAEKANATLRNAKELLDGGFKRGVPELIKSAALLKSVIQAQLHDIDNLMIEYNENRGVSA